MYASHRGSICAWSYGRTREALEALNLTASCFSDPELCLCGHPRCKLTKGTLQMLGPVSLGPTWEEDGGSGAQGTTVLTAFMLQRSYWRLKTDVTRSLSCHVRWQDPALGFLIPQSHWLKGLKSHMEIHLTLKARLEGFRAQEILLVRLPETLQSSGSCLVWKETVSKSWIWTRVGPEE